MTKDEALRLALEALEDETSEKYCPAITAIKEALAESEPNYKKALEVWLDKTEWVQETVKPHELGMHRADVLKQRIEEALAQPNFCPICGKRLGTNDWDIHTCTPPQRTWVGLTDEEISASSKGHMTRNGFARTIEAKLKEKNT